MNKLIYSLCVGSLAVAFTAQAADQDDATVRTRRRAQNTTAPTTQATVKTNNSAQVNLRRNNNGARYQRSYNANVKANATLNNSVSVRHANRYHDYDSNVAVQRNVDRNRVRTGRNYEVSNSGNVTVDRTRNFDRTGRNYAVNRQRNFSVNGRRNVTITNNWTGSRFSGQQYTAFRNYHRQWHDRNWWTSHYNNIILVGGGWYYWNSGYWYPAWGYNPGYSYPYDGPIYGYNNLTPDRVVVSVQEQLARDGYYAGPIDGDMGPMTRQAIADFQADNGLAVTASVDQPTLATLGLV